MILLRKLLGRARGRVGNPEQDTGERIVQLNAELLTIRQALAETMLRLEIAAQRLSVVQASNRTAARGLRKASQENARLVQEREAAEVKLSIAISDQQRTMVLNDRLLSDLRDSEDARLALEAETRRLRNSKALHDRDGATDCGAKRLPGIVPEMPPARRVSE